MYFLQAGPFHGYKLDITSGSTLRFAVGKWRGRYVADMRGSERIAYWRNDG